MDKPSAVLRRTIPALLLALLAWAGPNIGGTNGKPSVSPGPHGDGPIRVLPLRGDGEVVPASARTPGQELGGVPYTSGCDPLFDTCSPLASLPFVAVQSLAIVCKPPSCEACCESQSFCSPFLCSVVDGCHDSSADPLSFAQDSHHCCTLRQRPCDDHFEVAREVQLGAIPSQARCLAVNGNVLIPAESDSGPGCTFFCGDGVWHPAGNDLLGGTPDDEECDDGNTVGGDGCSALCKREPLAFQGFAQGFGTAPPEPFMQFGRALAGGGSFSDGKLRATAVTVGAPGLDVAGLPDAGAVFLVDAEFGTTLTNVTGATAGARMGSSVDQADFTGDGFVDSLGCAPGEQPSGQCLVINGAVTGPAADIVQNLTGPDSFGVLARYADDKGDGDLLPDFLVVSESVDPVDLTVNATLISLNSSSGAIWTYLRPNRIDAVAEIDDVDSDGVLDVIVSGPEFPSGFLNITVLSGNTAAPLGSVSIGPFSNLSSGPLFDAASDLMATSIASSGNWTFVGLPFADSVLRFDHTDVVGGGSGNVSNFAGFDGAIGFGASLLITDQGVFVGAPGGDNEDGRLFMYNLTTGTLLATLAGETEAGWKEFFSLTAVEDINGDGQPEVVAGAPFASPDHPVTQTPVPDAGIVRVLSFVEADSDSDGVLDDGDGSQVVGDAPCIAGMTLDCDDNCRTHFNPGQEDLDGDGEGDACDCGPDGSCHDELGCLQQGTPDLDCPSVDPDGDGVSGATDLCPGTIFGQPVDASGCSDIQVDADLDGLCNPGAPSSGPSGCVGVDNCPTMGNSGQEDLDLDDIGDPCDDDIDGDGVPNILDCLAFDPGNWGVPVAVTNLTVLPTSNEAFHQFHWNGQDVETGSDTVYDVVAGPLADLPAGQFGNIVCLGNDLGASSLVVDTSGVPFSVAGGGFVLARAENLCGSATYFPLDGLGATLPELRTHLDNSSPCPDLNGPGVGGCNCCNGGNGVGCDCQACEDIVCGVDPFCCRSMWDAICNQEAQSMCTCCTDGCAGGGAGAPTTQGPAHESTWSSYWAETRPSDILWDSSDLRARGRPVYGRHSK